ncbi:MAG: chromosome segregation protein SMC, partial [Chlorobiales bacterium]|nr:chromosome segregation protein SMC [Chlorobiales bacterium]
RRKQTFRQLESTTRDLERVNDVLAEVTKKARSLKSQVRKAEQYHELNTALRELDLTLSKLSFDEYFDELKPLKTKISDQETIIQELTTKIASRDSLLQESELEQLEQERLLSEAQTALNEKNKVFHTLEKNILQMQEQEKNLRDNIIRITESIAGKKQQAIELENDEKKLSGKLEPFEEDCSAKERELSSLKKEQESLQSVLALSRQEVEKVRESISEHQKAGSLLHIARQRLETTTDHLKSTISGLDNHKNELLGIINDTLPARNRLLELIDTRQKVIASEKKELLSLKKLQQDLSKQLEAGKEYLLEIRSRLDHLRNRILLADSILDNYEGLPEGIAWLENGDNGKTGYGCLSDLISLEDSHRKAVNAVLSDSLSYYVCSSLQEAKAGIRSLSQAGKGKVTFLVLEMVRKPEPVNLPEIEGAQKIKSILSIPRELDDAITLLTGHCYIAKDLKTAEKLALENPGCTFVTPDGEKIGGNGIVFGGSTTENEGLRLGKKAERDRLRAEERDLEKEIRVEEAKLQSLKNKLQDVRLEEKEQHLVSLEKELGDHEKNLARMDA